MFSDGALGFCIVEPSVYKVIGPVFIKVALELDFSFFSFIAGCSVDPLNTLPPILED